ncbi:uncharacterized protein [Macrobrachium rosenbergii]|uniref:uncharacterized protein n=1 Tax=Macrobrachium rosenbergii TaxID=79674 RepID=UPI0034D5B4C6
MNAIDDLLYLPDTDIYSLRRQVDLSTEIFLRQLASRGPIPDPGPLQPAPGHPPAPEFFAPPDGGCACDQEDYSCKVPSTNAILLQESRRSHLRCCQENHPHRKEEIPGVCHFHKKFANTPTYFFPLLIHTSKNGPGGGLPNRPSAPVSSSTSGATQTLVNHPEAPVGFHQSSSALLTEFPGVFKPELRLTPGTPAKHGIYHHISTKGPPVYAKFRQLPQQRLQEAKKAFAEMERMGICRKASSPWASPLHMVKKADGTWRPCGDCRRLNIVTEPDHYPLPNMQDLTSSFHGAKIVYKVDLLKSYFQVPVAPEDIPKTAIITPFGSFVFAFSTFGLRNAGVTFQHLMDSILGDLDFCVCYVDDILIFSRSWEEHLQLLRAVLKRLNDNGLIVRFNKCTFGVEKIEFLGHEISTKDIHPLSSKVRAIEKFPMPTSIKALQEFLGMVIHGTPHPFAFFSKKLSPTEARYSTFDRELLAAYVAVRHFKFLLEGGPSSCGQTTNPGPRLHEARAILCRRPLRIEVNSIQLGIDYEDLLAREQAVDPETPAYCIAYTSLVWRDVPFGNSGLTLLCDTSTGRPCPLIPASRHKKVFDVIHGLSHSSGRNTSHILTEKFMWHRIRKHARTWAKQCLHCQRSKISRHTESGVGEFPQPRRHFGHIHVDIKLAPTSFRRSQIHPDSRRPLHQVARGC